MAKGSALGGLTVAFDRKRLRVDREAYPHECPYARSPFTAACDHVVLMTQDGPAIDAGDDEPFKGSLQGNGERGDVVA